jgi:hypothetical protein
MRLSGHVRTQASSGSSTWQKMRDFGLLCAFYIAVSSRNIHCPATVLLGIIQFGGFHGPSPHESRVACKDHKCDSNIQQQDYKYYNTCTGLRAPQMQLRQGWEFWR